MIPENRIAELRKRSNMTQSELAKVIGMSTSTVAMWELGERDPSSQMLSNLANTFGVSIDYLLGRSSIEGGSSMTFDKTELLIMLESLSYFEKYVSDDLFAKEVKELKEKIRVTFK